MQTPMIELGTGKTDGRGFEPLVPCGTHAFQACTIDRSVTHPSISYSSSCSYSAFEHEHDYKQEQELQLQPPEQFIERKLNADEEFSEVRVVGADFIEAHFVDDFLNLKGIARKKCDAPLGIIKAGRAGDELFHFAGKFAADLGMAAH